MAQFGVPRGQDYDWRASQHGKWMKLVRRVIHALKQAVEKHAPRWSPYWACKSVQASMGMCWSVGRP